MDTYHGDWGYEPDEWDEIVHRRLSGEITEAQFHAELKLLDEKKKREAKENDL